MRAHLAQRLGAPSIEEALDGVARRGFAPALILDVGAYHGEFAAHCLRRWPTAAVSCVEPLESACAVLARRFAAEPRIHVHAMLLGATDAPSVPLHESETASSVFAEHVPQPFPVRAHPMRAVDSLVPEALGRAPDLLKLDVQGYELEVLRGAERTLPGIGMILAELNLLAIHRGVPLLHEVVGWLADRGWVAYDVCGLTRRPLDGALWQADLLFVPAHAALRGDRRWS